MSRCSGSAWMVVRTVAALFLRVPALRLRLPARLAFEAGVGEVVEPLKYRPNRQMTGDLVINKLGLKLPADLALPCTPDGPPSQQFPEESATRPAVFRMTGLDYVHAP